jgi:signal transduction histidine kinase
LGYFNSKLINQTSIQALLQDKDLHLVLEPADTIPTVRIDQDEIQRVLVNLIKNAVDHSPKGSTIRISLEWQRGYVRVNVEDSGSGVSPDMEPLLFTPYITSATKKFRPLGMGLGLYLSKFVIEAHGGSIGYLREDPGSLFYFTLPAAPAAVTPQPALAASSSTPQRASSL